MDLNFDRFSVPVKWAMRDKNFYFESLQLFKRHTFYFKFVKRRVVLNAENDWGTVLLL